MAEHDIGDVVYPTAAFTDSVGTAFDPTELTFTVEAPDDTQLAYVWETDDELVRESTGVFSAAVTLNQAGIWRYQFDSPQGREEGVFEVNPSLIGADGDLRELLPDVDAVGALLHDRTVDDDSAEVGTFTANTRPTASDVRSLIAEAANDVAMAVGTKFTDAKQRRAARSLITLGASLLVELSFFRDQLRNDSEAYDRAKDLYDERTKRLIEAVAESGEGGDGDSVATHGFLPTGTFPDPACTIAPGAERPV